MVVAPEIKDSAVGLLVVNRERGVLDSVVAVRAPSAGTQRMRILDDLAVITGGRCISIDRGDRLADVTIDDLGRARQAWATRFAFGILGGRGSKGAIRQRILEAKAELGAVERDDVFTREKIQERIGKLAGTAAVIHVGASTTAEQAELKLRIEAGVTSGRAALKDGVVPGGGAAMLACVAALEAIQATGDEGVGIRSLAHALAEPMRALVGNAGIEAGPIVDRARQSALAYDVVRREWVDPWSAGLVDPLPVVLAALETAVSTAMMAVIADVLIRRTNAPLTTRP
jgi:chaperonin GroEL